MTMPRKVKSWPFDLGNRQSERERLRAATHIPDSLRVGAIAGDEGSELRIEGHLMACEVCREASISLWEQLRANCDPPPFVRQTSCAETRNTIFRHAESGRPLDMAATAHLEECVSCSDHFVDPARATYTLEVDEEAIAAQD